MKRAVLFAAAVFAAGCPPERAPAPPAPSATVSAAAARSAPDPLAIPFQRSSFSDSPQLLARILESPFGYFRYVNGPFVRAVCKRYAGRTGEMPQVNLHGDAHLEQYAVAADGRGLADFDAAAVGPPIVDLVRFATSIVLASGGDRDAAKRAIEAFLQGYERALDDPGAQAPEPAVATRIRATFSKSAGEWLDRVEKLILPVDEQKRTRMEEARAQYVGAMLTQNPDLSEAFFRLKRIGALKMGVGSAHEAKFLARVEGPTESPEDDVILETKEMLALPGDSCVGGQEQDPLRVIVGQSRLGTTPQRFLGYVELEGKTFYVHAWRVHYTELSLGDLKSADELVQVAYDVGLQLGRGHPKNIADPHGRELRGALRRVVEKVRPELPDVAFDLASRVTAGWEEFRRAAREHPVTMQ